MKAAKDRDDEFFDPAHRKKSPVAALAKALEGFGSRL